MKGFTMGWWLLTRWVTGLFLFVVVTPGYAQPAPPSPPSFSVFAPVSGTIAVTTTTARLQLPNSLTQYPSVAIINEGPVEVFVSIGGAAVSAVACASNTGTCNSIPVLPGASVSGFVGGGYVAAITASSTSVVRVVQFNGRSGRP